MSEILNILGKDYLTQAEAAHYCGLSLRQFQSVAAGYGIRAGKFAGKLLYRRVDLQDAIEREWLVSGGSPEHGFSIGATRTGRDIAKRSDASASSPNAKPDESSNNETSNSQPATAS